MREPSIGQLKAKLQTKITQALNVANPGSALTNDELSLAITQAIEALIDAKLTQRFDRFNGTQVRP